MQVIDAHHHFWAPSRGDYGWMPADDPILSRPYGPQDLAPALASGGVTRTVLVQAAPTVTETEYLLELADATPHVAAVVGWIDFEDRHALRDLERLARHPKFVGVRPMIQDLPQDDWMLRQDVQWAFAALTDLDLTLDCLGLPRHIAPFLTLLTRYKDLRAVLDHGLKPQFRDPASLLAWRDGMASLAQDTSACVKLSGLVTEADDDWSDAILRPITDHVLDVFAADRVMWGSDWPVVRLRQSYADWLEQATRLTARCCPSERAAIFAGTAERFYRL